ncbi:MAG: DUF362 domain-containing protein [Candidatus Omnitrophica bacterium]|nr:DUF362 domain-containing protein [Candidatus Omnitrophota bacterium]
MNRSQVSIVRCKSYETKEVEVAVKKSVELLGGIERFVKPNSRVLLKPNLLSARTPDEGVNTHPEVIRVVARLIKPVTSQIFVGDSPGGWELKDVGEVYEKAGVKKVCDQEGLKLVKFDKAIEINGFPIAAVTKEVDAIISLPKFKTHTTTTLTGAIKNMFGMVVGLYKAQCHLRAPMPDEFASLLVKVFGLVKPTLSIMDGIIGMEGEGPAAGALRNIGLVMASQDAVALDTIFARLIGIEPDKIFIIQKAAKMGEGIADLERIDVFGENLKTAEIKNFKLPKTSVIYNLPRLLIHFGSRHIRFYPFINKKRCQRCELCFKICPTATIKKLQDGTFKVDIKDCIRCFCCYEVCPHKTITLRKSLLAKVIMR